MALPVGTGSAERRDEIVRMLTASPEGLSDAALALALGGPDAGVRTQTVNQLCRRMVTEGRLERVGTRPILNRVIPTEAPSLPAEDAPDPGPAAPTTNGSAAHVPVRDALQAWSRAVNVQAAVAEWLAGRGATIRWATDGQGPARDLVVSLDGDDVHVEVTGWPPDGARTHPTTIAGDWFHAAEHAATERRRTLPSARIVIALPDTRRYRALTRDRAEVLDGARAEVWFVDPAGVVHPS